ncbi:cell division protein ZapE, partial [Dickeya dadantii]|nr:cell division protein ZapE [Dickeya dadantii]
MATPQTTRQQTTPLALYQQALSAGEYQPDEVQRQTVVRLEAIHQALCERAADDDVEASGRVGKWRS